MNQNQRPPEPDFTLDQWLKDLEDKANLQEGLTRREIEEATGMGKTWVLSQLRKLKAEGRLTVVRKKIEALDGKMFPVPAYRIIYNDDEEDQDRTS